MRANACEYKEFPSGIYWFPSCGRSPIEFQERPLIEFQEGPLKAGWRACPFCGGRIVEIPRDASKLAKPA